jgi:hypothetical protein
MTKFDFLGKNFRFFEDKQLLVFQFEFKQNVTPSYRPTTLATGGTTVGTDRTASTEVVPPGRSSLYQSKTKARHVN